MLYSRIDNSWDLVQEDNCARLEGTGQLLLSHGATFPEDAILREAVRDATAKGHDYTTCLLLRLQDGKSTVRPPGSPLDAFYASRIDHRPEGRQKALVDSGICYSNYLEQENLFRDLLLRRDYESITRMAELGVDFTRMKS